MRKTKIKGLVVLLFLGFAFFHVDANAVQNQCTQLGLLFHEKFDCCGSSGGFPGCLGVEKAYQAADCGVLSCVPPEGTIVYRESFSSNSPIKIYDIFSESVFDPGLNGRWGFPANSGEIKVIDGKKIVFNSPSSPSTLLIYDIPTANLVDTGVQFARADSISFDGSIVAFSDCPLPVPCTFRLKYYDISTGLTTDTGEFADFPQVSGDHIVMARSGIRIFRISTGQTTVIRGGQNTAIDGDLIAFRSGGTNDSTIMYYRISTGQLADTGVPGVAPAVSGDLLSFVTFEFVLDEDLNGDRDKLDRVVVVYDTSTWIFRSTNITTGGSSSEMTMSFDKNIVTIREKETGNIFIYDVLTGRTIDTGISGFFPSVEGK